jgi:hypothetical protein
MFRLTTLATGIALLSLTGIAGAQSAADGASAAYDAELAQKHPPVFERSENNFRRRSPGLWRFGR